MVASDLDGVILVGGPTRLTAIRDAVAEYFQQEPRQGVDPDEVVAMGAAIHAASFVEEGSGAYLLDVTPLSLQIGVAGGLSEPVIERNTPVPIEQTRSFTTARDGQTSVKIKVYQGESREAAEKRTARRVRVLRLRAGQARRGGDRRQLPDQHRRHRPGDRLGQPHRAAGLHPDHALLRPLRGGAEADRAAGSHRAGPHAPSRNRDSGHGAGWGARGGGRRPALPDPAARSTRCSAPARRRDRTGGRDSGTRGGRDRPRRRRPRPCSRAKRTAR